MIARKSVRGGAARLQRSPIQLLHRAQQLALDIYAQELGADAITHRQFAVLTAVADAEGAPQIDLVRTTGIDRSTLADMVARMVAKGLLARERSAVDGRANAVRLTAAGRAALDEAAPKVARADTQLLKLLGSAEARKLFTALLQGLAQAGEEREAVAQRRSSLAATQASGARRVRRREPG